METATTEDFSVVRREGRREVKRNVKHYDLGAVISVGYRVNSKRGVAFRQWATRILRQRLVADYQKRSALTEQYRAGFQNVELLAQHASDTDAAAILDLIGRYARSWRLLLQYDENKLPLPPPPTHAGKRMQRHRAQPLPLEGGGRRAMSWRRCFRRTIYKSAKARR